MERIEHMLDDEFRNPATELAMELAREDQRLITRLIELRREAGLTQEDLAELIGISQATISSFERIGNDPRLSTVRRYARALGVMVRHHVAPEPVGSASHYLAHVSDHGIDAQATAAAIRRGLKPANVPSWDQEPVHRASTRGAGER